MFIYKVNNMKPLVLLTTVGGEVVVIRYIGVVYLFLRIVNVFLHSFFYFVLGLAYILSLAFLAFYAIYYIGTIACHIVFCTVCFFFSKTWFSRLHKICPRA